MVSGTTVIAGVAGWLMFSQVRDLFHGVAGQNIPEIVATLGLQTETQTLAASPRRHCSPPAARRNGQEASWR